MNKQIEKFISKLLKEKVNTVEVETEEDYYFRDADAIPNDTDFIRYLNYIDKGNYMMIEFNIYEKFVTIIKKKALNATHYKVKIYEAGLDGIQCTEHKFFEVNY